MEGFGNYNPDDKRELNVVEKSMAAIANLGEYMPDTWKNKLRLYEVPRPGGAIQQRSFVQANNSPQPPHVWSQRFAPNSAFSAMSEGSSYNTGNFNIKSRSNVFGNAEARVPSPDRGRRSPPLPEVTSIEPGEYEARLVRRMVQPRGGRSRPTPSELASFKESVAGLDLNHLLKNLSQYICDENQTWPWRYRALATLDSLTKSDTKADQDLASRVLKWLRDINGENLISVLKKPSTNRQWTSLSEAILAQAGRKGIVNDRSERNFIDGIDLLDEMDVTDITEPSKNCQGKSRPNLLEDLL